MSWIQKGLDFNGTNNNDQYAYSVALSGDGNTVAFATQTGSNYINIYEWNGTSWVLKGSPLTPISLSLSSQNISLSYDGNRLAIATGNTIIGAIIYDYSLGSWDSGTPIAGENYSVSLSDDGTTVAIGDPATTQANIYRYIASVWTQIGLTLTGGTNFGIAVSLSNNGDILAVSEFDNPGGSVFKYIFIAGSWILDQTISALLLLSEFGLSISLSDNGNIVAVGANDANIVRVYDWSGAPIQIGPDITTLNPNNFGYSISLSADGQTIAIGAPNTNQDVPGYIHIRKYNGSVWTLNKLFLGDSTGDRFGFSVSLSSDGNTVAFGSPNNDNTSLDNNGQGQVWFFNAPICFMEDTKILCLENNQEVWLPIQYIQKNTLVKTIRNGYLPVNSIGYSFINNPDNNDRISDRLYELSTNKYPELFRNLYITGAHSILVDKLSEQERQDTINSVKKIFVTDKKYRLMAYLDHRAKPYNVGGTFKIWHLALNSDSELANYGIYANGLLVETVSIKWLRKKMNLIN